MPGAPRPKGKGKKIAYAILGVPQNMMRPRRSSEDNWVERRLVFEDTSRVR